MWPKVDAAGSRASDNADEDFTTALLVQFDGDTLTMIPCGPPLPLLGQGQAVQSFGTTPSLPLCLGTEASADELRLAPGSGILFFSDGAFEGRDAKGDYFDLQSSFARHVGTPHPDAVLDAIVVDLDRHCDGGISDDVLLLIAEQSIDPSSDREE